MNIYRKQLCDTECAKFDGDKQSGKKEKRERQVYKNYLQNNIYRNRTMW